MSINDLSKLVILGMGLMLAVVGITDIWLSLHYSSEVSISATVHALASRYPALPFAIGMLMGHLFWR